MVESEGDMTDAERIKRLAEFMRWEWIDPLHIKDENGEFIFDGTQWNPLTRIQDAWMLVEKLVADNQFFNLQGNPNPNSSNKYEVWIYTEEKCVQSEAVTASEAICQTVFKLIEEKK